MWPNKRTVFFGLLLVFGVGCWICAADTKKEKGNTPPVKIKVEDLCSGKYIIIGRLGKPCGTIVHIRGVWNNREKYTKAGYYIFQITEIDGRKIDDNHPVAIRQEFIKRIDRNGMRPPKLGEVYEGRVYEGCGYLRGKPAELRDPRMQAPYGFDFVSFLYFVD